MYRILFVCALLSSCTTYPEITPCATNTCNNQSGAKCICTKSVSKNCYCPVFESSINENTLD